MNVPFWRSGKNYLRVACLSVCLAAAWGVGGPACASIAPPSPMYHISGSVTPNQNMSNVYVLAEYYAIGSPDASWAIQSLGALAGGSTTSFSYDVYAPVDHFGYYTIVGLYNYAAGGVTTGMNGTDAADAINLHKQWADVFIGRDSESTVATALQNNDPWAVTWLALYGANVGSTVKLVNFTGATDGGKADLTAHTPLPPSLLLMVPALGVAVMLRRRKSL